MLLLRDVQKSDLAGLKRVAASLDSQNLPNDEKALAALIDESTRSFTAKVRDPFERHYVFVLEEPRTGKIIGSSMIIAQHGTRESPHVYFDVYEKEHYSSYLDVHVKHRVLQIGYNFEGPTEIGGLIVAPESRGHAGAKPGKQISFVRFLYLAMHKAHFQDRVLAELLPPLSAEGKSLLWEAFGAKFTGLSYQEADRASRLNKEFIQQLFPQGEVYLTLLPQKVQDVVGEVGPETVGVKKMLERIGFKYDERIDPFDGGPHFSAPVKDVNLVQGYRKARLAPEPLDPGVEASPASPGRRRGRGPPLEVEWEQRLVAVERTTGRARFRAVRAACRIDDDVAYLPREAREALGAEPGERVHTIPFE